VLIDPIQSADELAQLPDSCLPDLAAGKRASRG
jgi:hypothetical protein